MNKEQLVKFVRRKVRQSGLTQQAWADMIGTHPVQLSRFLTSDERPPPPALLKHLGLRRVTTERFEKIDARNIKPEEG